MDEGNYGLDVVYLD